jgi:hypothetical protein
MDDGLVRESEHALRLGRAYGAAQTSKTGSSGAPAVALMKREE